VKTVNFFLILAALAGIGAALMKYFGEVLRDPEKEALQKRFDDWWRAVSNTNNHVFALTLAKQLSQWLDNYFGGRLISKRAFGRSFYLSSFLLVLGLGLTGVHNGQTIGLAPWTSYHQAMQVFQMSLSHQLPTPTNEVTQQQERALRQIQQTILKYNTTTWTIAYSVISLLALALLNTTLFFLSLIYSRMILREIIVAGRVFSMTVLLIANFALLVPAWLITFLLDTALLQPLLWTFIPITYFFTEVSIFWLLGIITGGSIVNLAIGNRSLEAITLIGFAPCIFIVCVTVFSALTLLNREKFHSFLCWFLKVCVEKGPAKVTGATLALVASVLGAVLLVFRYWK
jgi:hypothetical protein